jgi:hypothetical protein
MIYDEQRPFLTDDHDLYLSLLIERAVIQDTVAVVMRKNYPHSIVTMAIRSQRPNGGHIQEGVHLGHARKTAHGF